MKKALKTNTAGKQICMYCLLDFFYTFFKGRSKNKKIYGSIFQSVTDIGFARKKIGQLKALYRQVDYIF